MSKTIFRSLLHSCMVLLILSCVVHAAPITSDDFSAPSLNTGLWTVINPLNDGTFTMTGAGTSDARLSLFVPGGTSHDVWSGNKAPRIMQTVSNTDFEIEVKFESQLTAKYQMQGIIVEQDGNNYLRFDFYNDGVGTRAFAASFTGGTPTARSNVAITGGNPLYLRVKRVRNQWTQSYSYNGVNWTTAGSFSHGLTVSKTGPFAGNHGAPVSATPAFTCLIDYFFNTASPIVPEDISDTTPPVIDVWYGPSQTFGAIGIPQAWVNILGNVSDSSGIASLSYSLNGGPAVPLSVGPDGIRLQSNGDFNIDMAYADLLCNPSLNQVEITASDFADNTAVETVTIPYDCNNFWPKTYAIDWSTVSNIQSVAQIVDGKWTLGANSIRPEILGYDRMVLIGDITWDDYEITVPITINSPMNPSVPWGPLVGILMRWQGHYDWDGTQPNWGWYPLGALGLYDWVGGSSYRLRIIGNAEGSIAEDTSGRQLAVGVPYMFKMRAETVGGNSIYSLKVWEQGTSEPAAWDISGQGLTGELKKGSLALLSHYTDASFGNVTITPGPFATSSAPSITTQPSNKTVTAGQTATFSVTATGTAPLSYQWQKNGTNISGATSATYTTPATTLADSGSIYRCVVSNSVGSATSNAATLTVTSGTAVNLITNPGFESGKAPWIFYTNGAGTFQTDVAGPASAKAGHIVITTAGTNVQLYQKGITLQTNTKYRLSFKAKSGTGHDLSVRLLKGVSPYTNYGLNTVFNLTTSWANYSVEFTTTGFPGTVSDGQLQFWVAPYDAAGDHYYIDDVVLQKI